MKAIRTALWLTFFVVGPWALILWAHEFFEVQPQVTRYQHWQTTEGK